MTSQASAAAFDLPAAHVIELQVEPTDVDAYEHVNNAVYLTWLDRAAECDQAARSSQVR